MKIKLNWDAMGIATSVACAIHCAILPLIVTSLPLFGINIIHNLFFEWSMIAIAFAIGYYSLFHGYKKHHRSLKPMILFTIGFAFLIIKQVLHAWEFFFLPFAVVFIITAHYNNYRLCNKSKCSSPHHQH
ncbi:MAG: MerC domain-containing protein [Sphingobacteriales bacterium]|nr:MerC domain-containing protein [Sphingobacteriales bacterium]